MTTRPTSATSFFDTILPPAITADPAKAREVGAIYAFLIRGDGGGEWTADLASAAPKIYKGVQPIAQCTIEIANEDFIAWFGDPNVGTKLYFSGKLRVTGDPMLMMKAPQIFSLA